MPEGFAGGFLGGMQTVGGVLSDIDRAAAERERLAAEKERFGAEQQNADRAFGLQTQQFQANKEHQDQALGLQGKELTERIASNIRKEKSEADQLAETSRHNKESEKNDSFRTANQNAHYAAQIGLIGAQKNASNQEADRAKTMQNRQDAAMRLSVIANAGGIDSIPPEQMQSVYGDLNTIGFPMASIGQGDKPWLDDLRKTQGAIMLASNDHKSLRDHPEAADALDSFNRLFQGQINTNTGARYSGGNEELLKKNAIISNKRIIDVQPVMKSDGTFGKNFHMTVQESYSYPNGEPILGEDGKPITTEGPVTINRTNNPKDPVREFTIPELVKAANAQLGLYKYMQENPELLNQVRQVSNFVLNGGKPAKAEHAGKWEDTGEQPNDKGERLYHNDTTNELRWVAPSQADSLSQLSPDDLSAIGSLKAAHKSLASPQQSGGFGAAQQQSLPSNAEGSSTYQIRTKSGELVDVNNPNVSIPYSSRH